LRFPRPGGAAAGAFQSRGSDGQFPRHFCRPARQGLLHIRVLRSSLHPWTLPLRGAAASCHRRGAGVDRGTADLRVRHGWWFLLALGSGSHRPCARAPFDGRRRRTCRNRARPHRTACPMDVADRHLRYVWIRLLPPARLYPGPCHRTLADGTRRGRLVAFILLLPWPSRRPGGLRLWFCPWRAGAEHSLGRSGGDDRRRRVLAAIASPDRVLRSLRPLRHRTPSPTALCNGARMPIIGFEGLGCRAHAAEITPMEPVWVIPAKGAAGCRTAPHSMSERPRSPSSAPASSALP